MGLFSPKPKKQTTTDVTFKTEPCPSPTVLGSQNGDLHNVSWQQVENGLEDVFGDSNQFLVLTLQKIRHNIRYVQATQCDDGIVVQLGVENNNTTKLVEKICSEEECIDIFKEFYNSSAVKNLQDYTPVKFFV
jgi:hypothetical protein